MESTSITNLMDYTFISKYARWIEDKKRRETWDEAVDRVLGMHLERYPQVKDELTWAFGLVRQKKVLGASRVLQYAGKPILERNPRSFNCTSSYCDRPRFFQEAMYLLLCGCGVGFSVQKHHVAKLPPLIGRLNPEVRVTYTIPDSIEGWADSIGILVSSYLASEYNPHLPEYGGCTVDFDYSKIRPKGTRFSHGVGRAPGPDGLREAHENIRALLSFLVLKGVKKLRPIHAYDIVMYASDAVLSGGVRRSATLAMFSIDDEEMLKAKTGSWFEENPQRGRSNNSVVLLRNKTTKEDFHRILESTWEWGEPGFIWVDDLETLFNPCLEISMNGYDQDGNSGWQGCNLCEINAASLKTKEDLLEAARAAAIIGTCQAGYTDLPYLGPVSEYIFRREALLGVSMTGMGDNPEVSMNPGYQDQAAKIVLETNKEIAAKIGINPTARATCVKPAGTTSCVLGTSSGHHYPHARRYFRRSQANLLEDPFQFFLKQNPRAVEVSIQKPDTDAVITFCVEPPRGARTRDQVSAVEFLQQVRSTQTHWVLSGKNPERCYKPWLNHNVSNTVSVKEDERQDVEDYIYDHRQDFTGVSLIQASGDRDYPQAPFTEVFTPQDMVKMYGTASVIASGLIEKGQEAWSESPAPLWGASASVLGYGNPADTPKKKAWETQLKRFAERYLQGDVKKATYCLKDVHNWKLWEDLIREYRVVDYTLLREEEDNTSPQEELACAGGACEL